MTKTDRCNICLDTFVSEGDLNGHKVVLAHGPLLHLVHRVCLLKWVKKSASCPECRQQIDLKSLLSSNEIEQLSIHWIKEPPLFTIIDLMVDLVESLRGVETTDEPPTHQPSDHNISIFDETLSLPHLSMAISLSSLATISYATGSWLFLIGVPPLLIINLSLESRLTLISCLAGAALALWQEPSAMV